MAGELKRLEHEIAFVDAGEPFTPSVADLRTALDLLERAAKNHLEMQDILATLRVHPMRNVEDWLADYSAAKGE